MDISHCSECNKNKIVKVKENGKEFIVNNNIAFTFETWKPISEKNAII